MTTHPKRKRTQIPALLRAAHVTTPFAVICTICHREYGRTQYPATNPGFGPPTCAACKRAMREGVAA